MIEIKNLTGENYQMMNKIQCVLSIKEFSVTEYGKEVDYIAIFPTDIPENVVNDAIKYKFESLGEIDYKQIIIVQKDQYDTVLKPQMDILHKFNQSIEEYNKCQSGVIPAGMAYQQGELGDR